MHSFWLILLSTLLYIAGALLLAGGVFWGVSAGAGALFYFGGLGMIALFVGFLLDTANEILRRLERVEAELKKSREQAK
jgi:uncharacterized membrane protein